MCRALSTLSGFHDYLMDHRALAQAAHKHTGVFTLRDRAYTMYVRAVNSAVINIDAGNWSCGRTSVCVDTPWTRHMFVRHAQTILAPLWAQHANFSGALFVRHTSDIFGCITCACLYAHDMFRFFNHMNTPEHTLRLVLKYCTQLE